MQNRTKHKILLSLLCNTQHWLHFLFLQLYGQKWKLGSFLGESKADQQLLILYHRNIWSPPSLYLPLLLYSLNRILFLLTLKLAMFVKSILFLAYKSHILFVHVTFRCEKWLTQHCLQSWFSHNAISFIVTIVTWTTDWPTHGPA